MPHQPTTTTVWQQRTQQGRPHAQHDSLDGVSTRTHPYDTTQQRSRSTQHSAAQHRSKHTTPSVPRTYVRTSSLAESQPAGQIRSDLHQRRHPRRRRRRTVPYVYRTQPPSKGSLRGSKCTPLCNSQLPACKPIVCRRSQVSKSYIDAEQRRQRSSISILAVRRRARALSSRSDQ